MKLLLKAQCQKLRSLLFVFMKSVKKNLLLQYILKKKKNLRVIISCLIFLTFSFDVGFKPEAFTIFTYVTLCFISVISIDHGYCFVHAFEDNSFKNS